MNIQSNIVEAVAHAQSDVLAQAVHHARLPLCLTDPSMPDNPIIFANAAFCQLTGYSADEILGKNCRFLQGAGTAPESIMDIKQAIDAQRVAMIEIENYRKDGTPFINALQIGPIFDSDGKLLYYFGSQLDVTEEREAEARVKRLADVELSHRLMNIISVLDVLVRLTMREELDSDEQVEKISARLRDVGNAHLLALTESEDSTLQLNSIVEVIMTAYAPQGESNYSITGGEVEVDTKTLTPLTMVLHELATNSVKHGALSRREGQIALSWKVEPGENADVLKLEWRESNGPPVSEPDHENGSKIVAQLLRAAKGELVFDWKPDGLVATATMLRPKPL